MDANTIAALRAQMAEKRAQPDQSVMARELLQREAIKRLQHIALTGLALGGTARGVYGLAGLMERNKQKEPREPVVNIPALPQFKSAAGPTVVGAFPWYYPGSIIAGVGGAGLGWKAIDELLHNRRKNVVNDEIEAAQREYEDALSAELVKSGADSLNTVLDEIFDHVQECKKAEFESPAWLTNLLGQTAGVGLGAMTVTGIPAFLLAYNQAKKQTANNALAKAQRRREQKMLSTRPSTLYAHPDEKFEG